MAKDEEGYEDALEQEIFELEAFVHKKGLDKQLELWRKGPEMNDDLKDYEQFIAEEAERIDPGRMEIKDEG